MGMGMAMNKVASEIVTAKRITPVSDTLIVRPIKHRADRDGLAVVGSVGPDLRMGEVVVSGLGFTNPRTGDFVPCDVTAGQKVLFSKRAGETVVLGGEEFIRISQTDCVATFDDGDF